MSKLYLYLDESGDFEERADARPSIIAGFFASKAIDDGVASDFLRQVAGHRKADGPFHATNRPVHEKRVWAERLKPALDARQWRAVIFEHTSGIEIVDNATTYLAVLAEGLVQLGTDLVSELADDAAGLQLHVTAAGRVARVAGSTDEREYTRVERYRRALAERVAVEQARTVPDLRKRLSIEIELADARKDQRLMVADLIAHLSSKRSSLGRAERAAIEGAVGRYHYATLSPGTSDRLRLAIQRGHLSSAIIDAVELARCSSASPADLESTAMLIQRLGAISAEALDRELKAALARVEARAAAHRPSHEGPAEAAEREVRLWRSVIVEPLRARVGPDRAAAIEWVELQLDWNLLTACNHAGSLSGGRAVRERLQQRLPSIAASLAHLPLALEIQFAEAVHLTDACAYEEACQAMDRLGENLEAMVQLFGELWPAGSPSELRSRLLGKAVGCSLQAWHKRGRRDPAAYREARERSIRALALFSAPDDLSRQYGYRCLIEADAGQLEDAWRFVARVVGAPEHTGPAELLAACARNPWSMLYWTHLWYVGARNGDTDLSTELASAWHGKALAQEASWLSSAFRFPGHLVAWKAGAAAWRAGQRRHGETLLRLAADHCFSSKRSEALRLIGLAVVADHAALAKEKHRAPLRRKLEKELDRLERSAPPSVERYLARWGEALAATPAGHEGERRMLESLAWDVCY